MNGFDLCWSGYGIGLIRSSPRLGRQCARHAAAASIPPANKAAKSPPWHVDSPLNTVQRHDEVRSFGANCSRAVGGHRACGLPTHGLAVDIALPFSAGELEVHGRATASARGG